MHDSLIIYTLTTVRCFYIQIVFAKTVVWDVTVILKRQIRLKEGLVAYFGAYSLWYVCIVWAIGRMKEMAYGTIGELQPSCSC